MKSLSRAAAALAAVALAVPCWAGQVKLEIRDGLVTLSAKDASVREILGEWARVGQTRIVNADRAPGGLLSIELSDVPEAKALDIVLRSVAGYVAAPRHVGEPAGSRFDRIVVMPVPRPASSGSAAAPTPVAAAPPPARNDPRTRMGGYQTPPSLMVDDQDEPVQPQAQPQPAVPTTGPQSATQPGMMTGPAQATPAVPGQAPVAPGQQVPQTQPGQQPNSPAAGRPGVMTPGATPRPPGAPGGPGGH